MPQRTPIQIAPNTPIKDLLPAPPAMKPCGPLLTDDLNKVPEADFQARSDRKVPSEKQAEQIAHQLAKINHLNAKKTDAFMAALLDSRDDLAGLPFVMGEDCRTSIDRVKYFTQAVATVRQALSFSAASPQLVTATLANGTTLVRTELIAQPAPNLPPSSVLPGMVPPAPTAPNAPNPSVMQTPVAAQTMPMIRSANFPHVSFWSQYASLCEQEDARSHHDKAKSEMVTLARIAALMQMLAPETPEIRLGLVKYLTAIPHVESTRALARMAIFSSEDEVRMSAIDSLKVRRDKDYTDILVNGLRYPWPAVAKRSAEAIARTGRTDMIPELLSVLESADPRMPYAKKLDGKSVSVVRELVKVNHHRNCMMCHAPGNPSTISNNVITAEVPVPGQPLPQPFEGYRQSSPDLMIRVDVTYLRQDFSALLAVGDAHPWPEMQRFDFLVRERKITAEEAEEYRVKLTPKEAGVLSPYHRSALAALRELSGKDTAPTAEAWRKILNLPAKEGIWGY